MFGSNLLEKDVHVGQYVQLVTKTTDNMFQHSYSLGHHEDRLKLNHIRKSFCYYVSHLFDMHHYSCTYRSVGVSWSCPVDPVDLVLIFQRQPSYLLPFFCLQVFDFCVNLLGAVGAISYIPELKLMLKNNVSFLNVGYLTSCTFSFSAGT